MRHLNYTCTYQSQIYILFISTKCRTILKCFRLFFLTKCGVFNWFRPNVFDELYIRPIVNTNGIFKKCCAPDIIGVRTNSLLATFLPAQTYPLIYFRYTYDTWTMYRWQGMCPGWKEEGRRFVRDGKQRGWICLDGEKTGGGFVRDSICP